jgi:creatinine amidohydrolase
VGQLSRIPKKQKEYQLSFMTWQDAKNILRRDPIVLIPFGNTEQHSYHLPLCVDNLIAEELALRASKLAARRGIPIILTPSIPVGYSMEHMMFPGTLSLRAETMIAIALDIVRSLIRHGGKRLFFVCAHKGHLSHLDVVSRIIRDETGGDVMIGLITWWKLVEDILPGLMERPGGHAGELETSIMLYLRPDLVKGTQKSSVRLDQTKSPFFIPMKPMNLLSKSGTTADSTTATREKGETMVKTMVTRLVQHIADVWKGKPIQGSELA